MSGGPCFARSIYMSVHQGRLQRWAAGEFAERRRVHDPEAGGDGDLERDMREHVALQVRAGSDLGEDEAVLSQVQHAALGDVADPLAQLTRAPPGEGHPADPVDDLGDGPVGTDVKCAVASGDIAPSGVEGPDEHDALRLAGDVREAADPGGDVTPAGQVVDVDVAFPVDLQEGEQGVVEAASLQERELVG